MHEVAAIQGAIGVAVEHMRKAGATRITSIQLSVAVSAEKIEYALDYHAIFTKVNGSTRAF